jgi:tyrosine-protein kinase Etk/Wzc
MRCHRVTSSSPITFGSLPPSIVFSSAEADEAIALSLARILANTGRNVLLLDGDLHRSSVAEILKLSMRPGLAELLSGAAQLEDVIQRDPRTSADVIVRGQRLLNASDLLTKPTFREVLRELEDRYETVVIDAPPVMALTDALALANAAATTIMIVKWGGTRREVVRYATMQLARVAKRFEGIVLTQVHLKSNARYGYGDSVRYSTKMAKYYQA